MNNTVTDVVMLIDDSRIDNFINQKALEREGFAKEIIVFNRAAKALSYLSQENCLIPGIILLDLIMPEMDGLAFLKEFKKLPFHISAKTGIVMLSNMVPMEMMKHQIAHPEVLAWMQKPLLGSNLVTLRGLMHRSAMAV